ncbi:histidine phosphatase family protein [Heyndrickxia sp. MSNUG]|uniref:histidine phosphatase family protein n=1 Tax=Heyndrickxia sp. MSNUG TaxID=3136677 RepID=UPI003C2D4F49
MKIGLLRHYKVTLGYPNKMVSSSELLEWQKEYDESELEETEIDLCKVLWKRCYSSDLPRATRTARGAFEGKIVYLEDLREMSIYPIAGSDIRLPLWFHIILIRIAWLLGHKSQKESKKQVVRRINRVLDQVLEQEEDVLIVGHGGIMIFMRKELLKRGFSGPKFNRPVNAKIYIFEKQ